MGSRNIGMFLEPGPETLNEISLVAPTGFEPVFQRRVNAVHELHKLPILEPSPFSIEDR